MASVNKPLLTIGIPTYNRADLLALSLSKIIEASIGCEGDIEVVISDNCSVDHTASVVAEAQKYFPFKYFRNTENIGFNYNYIKLIDEYATGTYSWIMGDDDFMYPNALKEVITVLKNHQELSFVYVNFDLKKEKEIREWSSNDHSEITPVSSPAIGTGCSFNQLISDVGAPGNLMLTFISTAVFKSDLMKSLDKSNIAKESWGAFSDLFPHSYLYARILKDKAAYRFSLPLITAVVHEKTWDTKVWELYLRFMPELHNHYLKCGFTRFELRNQEKLVISAGIPYLFFNVFSKKNYFRVKSGFLFRYISDTAFYSSFLNILRRKLFTKV